MGYGHAERNLALIRQLEAETRKLLSTLDQADPEQSAWLQGVAGLERRAGKAGLLQGLWVSGANDHEGRSGVPPGRASQARFWRVRMRQFRARRLSTKMVTVTHAAISPAPAAKALAQADPGLLPDLITRQVPVDQREDACAARPDGINAFLTFADAGRRAGVIGLWRRTYDAAWACLPRQTFRMTGSAGRPLLIAGSTARRPQCRNRK